MENKIYLMTPIFYLYEIKSLTEVIFNNKSSEHLKNFHSLEDRKKYMNN